MRKCPQTEKYRYASEVKMRKEVESKIDTLSHSTYAHTDTHTHTHTHTHTYNKVCPIYKAAI